MIGPSSTGSVPRYRDGFPSGRFARQGPFSGWITADGSSGYPAMPGRYHLYTSLAGPRAHHALIARGVLGLDDAVGSTITDPVEDEDGFHFGLCPDERDPVTGSRLISELYDASDPGYEGPCTIPVLWDRATGKIVSNDAARIAVMLETEFRAFHRPGSPDLYPQELRAQIDAVNALVFEHVGNGVYKAGRAHDQRSYEQAFDALFTTLDSLEDKLARHRYLVGDRLTEADVRLFPTLLRFDLVYYQQFKCNLRRLVDYPNLWAYARDLYQRPGFSDTSNFDHIKRHFYLSDRQLNPHGIVPKGPYADWLAPHGRQRLPALG